jgi:hypothetical protein
MLIGDSLDLGNVSCGGVSATVVVMTERAKFGSGLLLDGYHRFQITVGRENCSAQLCLGQEQCKLCAASCALQRLR